MTYTVIITTDSERTVSSGLTVHEAYAMWRAVVNANADMLTDDEYGRLYPESDVA